MTRRSLCFRLLAILSVFLAGTAALSAALGEDWEWRNPLPQGNALLGAAFGDGQFVAVGDVGTVLVSQDGATWQDAATATAEPLNAVAFGAGRFIAVGANGTVLTSPNGTSWTATTIGTTMDLHGVAYQDTETGGTFVVVGAGGTIAALSITGTGEQWTIKSSGVTDALNDVTAADGIWVAAGESGTILTSPDAEVWTAQTSSTTSDLNGVASGGGFFTAVGPFGTIVTSADGQSWETVEAFTFADLFDIAFAGDQFVAMGSGGTTARGAIEGEALSWSQQGTGTFSDLYSLAYDPAGGVAVAVGAEGAIIRSEDLDSWTESRTGSLTWFLSADYGTDRFIAVGETGRIFTSQDTFDWTQASSGTTNWLWGVTHGAGHYIAVGNNGTIRRSADSVDWTGVTSGTSNHLQDVAHGAIDADKGAFVAVGRNGTIRRSVDAGATWSSVTSGVTHWLEAVTYGEGLFVAVSRNGRILTSPTGATETWQEQTSGTSSRLEDVIFANGSYVAVGFAGTILTSPDGATWTAQTSGTSADLWGIDFGEGIFVAAGQAGTILTSTDAQTWTPQMSRTTTDLTGVAYGGGAFVVVGQQGTVLVSGEAPQDDSSFQQWLADHNVPSHLRGVDDDPAGDGVTNLVKYALGLDPLVPGADDLPTLEFATFEGGPALALRMTEATDAAVTLALEVSTNLVDWAETPHSLEVIESVSANVRLIRLVENFALDGSARRFLRLRVTLDDSGSVDPEPDTFTGWVSHHGLSEGESGPLDSPAGDGVANLTKFAMGIDPRVYTSSSSLSTQGEILVDGEAHMTLTFARSTIATGVEFVLQGSDDLNTWADLPAVLTVIGPLEGDREEVFLTDTEPKTSSRRFIRLLVRQLP